MPHAVSGLREFVNARADAPLIAAGGPLPAVVIASESPPPGVTVYSDPGLVLAVQFCADLEQTRTWVGDVLGPLASATDSDERMSETLREFLDTGSSFKATADELHLHVNSVKYRVQRALERRGRPTADDRLDMEVALLLCHWFDTAVPS